MLDQYSPLYYWLHVKLCIPLPPPSHFLASSRFSTYFSLPRFLSLSPSISFFLFLRSNVYFALFAFKNSSFTSTSIIITMCFVCVCIVCVCTVSLCKNQNHQLNMDGIIISGSICNTGEPIIGYTNSCEFATVAGEGRFICEQRQFSHTFSTR